AGREPDLGELGLRAGRLLDRVDEAEATQLAAAPRLLAPDGERGDVAQLERLLHAGRKITAVVGRAERVPVRHGGGRDEILPSQLHRIDTELAGGVVDQ